MKRFLMFFVYAACFSFCACSGGDNGGGNPTLPIGGLVMPSATTPIGPGEEVTINGEGFAAASEIWLRVTTVRVADGIKAVVSEVTATYIRFTAPESVSGKCSVVLKQNGHEYTLGTLVFAEVGDPGERTPTADEIIGTWILVDEDGNYNDSGTTDVWTEKQGEETYVFNGDGTGTYTWDFGGGDDGMHDITWSLDADLIDITEIWPAWRSAQMRGYDWRTITVAVIGDDTLILTFDENIPEDNFTKHNRQTFARQ